MKTVFMAMCVCSAAAFSAPKSGLAPVRCVQEKFVDVSSAPALAAGLAALAVPQMASADVGFVEEAAGVFLGIAPFALIARDGVV